MRSNKKGHFIPLVGGFYFDSLTLFFLIWTLGLGQKSFKNLLWYLGRNDVSIKSFWFYWSLKMINIYLISLILKLKNPVSSSSGVGHLTIRFPENWKVCFNCFLFQERKQWLRWMVIFCSSFFGAIRDQTPGEKGNSYLRYFRYRFTDADVTTFTSTVY